MEYAALNIRLGNVDIDTIHEELAELAKNTATATDALFASQFQKLIQHTREHFLHEEQLMRDSGFIHQAEHLVEHQQMLGEMEQFSRRPRPLARAYIMERLPERFALHISRMDSLLVAYLRTD